MSRYIDADALIENIQNGEHFSGWGNCVVEIENAPTVDAVPVVRCGECRHRYLEHDVWICRFGLMIPSPDGFCFYGEKVTE